MPFGTLFRGAFFFCFGEKKNIDFYLTICYNSFSQFEGPASAETLRGHDTEVERTRRCKTIVTHLAINVHQ